MTDIFSFDSNYLSRILVVSIRGFRFQVANCCIYELEDLLGKLERADLFVPSRDFALPQKIYRKTKQFGGSDFLAGAIAPFPKELTLEREYDLLLAVLDNPWQMYLLNAISGWREKCRYTACYIFEMWPPSLNDERLLDEPWQNFDRIFLGVTNCTERLNKLVEPPVAYLPPGIDTLAFMPYPNPPQRSIDVCYIGRRSPQVHNSLYRHSQQTNFFYYYDTHNKLLFENSQEHRAKLISLLKRSRYSIAYYAKFNSTKETGGSQEIGTRFFEGAAAGTVMLGKPPTGEAFPRCFDWEDAVIKVDLAAKDIVEAIAELDKQPERLDKIRRQNVANSLLKHDWTYRWRDLIAAFNLQPTSAMLAREKLLQEWAETILLTEAPR